MRITWRLGMEKAVTVGGASAPRKPVPWFGSVTVVTPGGSKVTRSWNTSKAQPLRMSDVLATMHAMVDDIVSELGHNQGVDAWWSVQSR